MVCALTCSQEVLELIAGVRDDGRVAERLSGNRDGDGLPADEIVSNCMLPKLSTEKKK